MPFDREIGYPAHSVSGASGTVNLSGVAHASGVLGNIPR